MLLTQKAQSLSSFHFPTHPSADDPPAPAEPDMSGVPKEYHEYTKVFRKDGTDTLSEHCPYDLKVDLEEGTEPLLGRMYSLSQTGCGDSQRTSTLDSSTPLRQATLYNKEGLLSSPTHLQPP